MRVLLLQLDGSIPNLALMRLAGFHRRKGDAVELRQVRRPESVEPQMFDTAPDRVYASLIFQKTRPVAERLQHIFPDVVIGGTGWDLTTTLEALGVPADGFPDYADYPAYPHSMGFTRRGCRLACSFCVVSKKEGHARESASILDIWRGPPWPRNLLLLDNDFFGVPAWRKRLDEIKHGGFRVCWNQGFNVRLIGDEEAAAIASTDYRDDQFKVKRLYTAWDSRKDEARLFRNLETLVRHGVKPDSIMVYMLVGYDHATRSSTPRLTKDDFHRHARLREFGCRPYPMPYVRNRETLGFQRWIVGAYDKRVDWADWERAGYDPRKLERDEPPLFVETV